MSKIKNSENNLNEYADRVIKSANQRAEKNETEMGYNDLYVPESVIQSYRNTVLAGGVF